MAAGKMPLKLYAALTGFMMLAWFLALWVTECVTGGVPAWGLWDMVLVVSALLVYSGIHEVQHWWMATMLGVKARVHPKPYGFYVELPGLEGKFSDLPREKKVVYSFIAVAPYVWTFPFAFVCIATGVVLPGLFLVFVSVVNLAAEWVVT
jgi:hypothetical protein